MRVLVLGGTRFIGLNMVRQLHRMGHEVAVFHRGNTPAELPEGVTEFIGDAKQLEEHRDTFERYAPDVVVHMMLVTEADGNRFMREFKGITGKVVAISSCDVYQAYGRLHGSEPGDPVPTPVTEESPLREVWYPYRTQFPDPEHPMHHYDKIPIERRTLSDPDMPGVILRLPMVYGARDYQRRLYPYLRRMDDGRPAIIMDKSAVSWKAVRGYVEDVGLAMAMAVVDPRANGRIYNVADDRVLTELEWAQAIADVAGWKGEFVQIEQENLPEYIRFNTNGQDLDVDSTRIRQELGFKEELSLDESIRRTIEWDRTNPIDPLPADHYDYETEDKILGQYA